MTIHTRNRNEIRFGGVPMQGEDPAFLAIWYSVKFYNIEIRTKISSECCILCIPHSSRHSLSPQTSEYHNNNLDSAIELYKKAIELHPEFGQAYSNLGLAYYKNGNKAEAIWANRKAIALASGSNQHITKANSYYKIARIYEDEINYDEAIRHYNLAHDNNPREAYTRGINRVRGKR